MSQRKWSTSREKPVRKRRFVGRNPSAKLLPICCAIHTSVACELICNRRASVHGALNIFGAWLIFYVAREDALVLLRVSYGMMDLPAVEFES
jgi:hypothetical protein